MTVYPLVACYECGAMYGYVEWLPWHVNGYCRLKCDPALGILCAARDKRALLWTETQWIEIKAALVRHVGALA